MDIDLLNANPGGQRCYVLLRCAICWRLFHEEQRLDIDLKSGHVIHGAMLFPRLLMHRR